MKIQIEKTTYSGEITAPPSKSAAHRRLICAALANGKSVIRGISESEDMKATIDCIKALGATVEKNGDTVTVIGCDPKSREKAILNCRESGSTLRFFVPICLLSDKEATLKGSERLMSRPLEPYEEICVAQGMDYVLTEKDLTVKGPITSGHFRLRGDVSSQFISGLMFALPLCDGFSVIELIPPVMSASYIAMTVEALKEFGVRVEITEDDRIIIPGGQKYKPIETTVEGDWSNAAFFLALNTLGSDIEINGLRRHSLQGDETIIKLLGKLSRTCPTIDIADCPDLAPILMATASALNGVHLINTDRLKIKESDRGEAMATELRKLGVTVTVGDNEITVTAPDSLAAPKEPLCGHNDHRIVMASAVILSLTGGEIDGCEAVSKSFPEFFEILDTIQ